MKTFYAPLSELAGIEQLKKDFEVTGQPVMISGCIDTQKIHLVHAAVNDYRFRLIITGDEAKAREMQEDSRFLINRVYTILRKISYFTVLMSMVISLRVNG